MYREQLLRCAASVPSVQPARGADLESIQKAESVANCTFPKELHELLSEMNGDGYLFFFTEEMSKRIVEVRTMLGEEYEGVDSLLFFAGNGCGDYYCYKILPFGQVDPDSIYIWMHEENTLKMASHNLSDFIRLYFNDEI